MLIKASYVREYMASIYSGDSRNERDNTDIKKLVQWFALNNPFSTFTQVVSISTGIVGSNKINCHIAKEIGQQSIKKL